MSNQPNYSRNSSHPRSYYSPRASMNSADSQYLYGVGREMAPPFLPQPIEIDNSRTLPTPSISASAAWDPAIFPALSIGEIPPYAPPNVPRQVQMDNQVRSVNQDPLANWYTENDGPWIPKGISEIPDDRQSRTRVSSRTSIPYGPYRQPLPSDGGSYAYGATPSDSGYGSNGARRSDGNASIFSADVVERDQDLQSLASHVADFQQYPGVGEVMQNRDVRQNDQWTATVPSSHAPESSSGLVCPTCYKGLKTRSELKKHDLRHRKPFTCNYPGCPRTEGFSTTNDLDRHTKSKHPQGTDSSKRFRCLFPGCKSKEKLWPRLDNFRSHLKRVHHLYTEDEEDLVRRGEFWDPTVIGNQDSISPSPQRYSLPSPPRPVEPLVNRALPRVDNIELNWKRLAPELEPSRGIPVLKMVPMEAPRRNDTLQKNHLSADEIPKETVKPVELLTPTSRVHSNPSSLGNILAPVSTNDTVIKESITTHPPITQPSKPLPQGKATRHDTSASETARLTEAMKTALVGAHILENDDHSLHHSTQTAGSAGQSTNGRSGLNLGKASTALGELNNSTGPSPTQAVSRDVEAQKKAVEVLKTLQNLGYILHKDPSHSPKPQNPGSAASSKSENLVICQQCGKFKGRPCELKKHMKRHSRPYGCTFPNCTKAFGSKNDWKRHENSQHFHLETWRCDEEKIEGGACAKVCYRKNIFEEHLKRDHPHSLSDMDAVKAKLETCRIGRNCQSRFWCGFCNTLIDLSKKGIDAWNERFSHIDDHFMGRHGLAKQNIQDWIPVDGKKPEVDASTSRSLGHSSDKEPTEDHSSSSSGSSNGSPPNVPDSAEGSSAHAATLETLDGPSNKRKRTGSADETSPPKRAKAPYSGSMLVDCCQCGFGHDPKNNKSCTNCDDAHLFCDNCLYTQIPNVTEDFLPPS